MKKSTSIILGLLVVLALVTASGSQSTAVAEQSEAHETVTPTVTETVTPTEEVSPTEEHSEEECTPTPTEEVTPTPTKEVTPTPTEEHHEESTPTPTPVLEVTTMAKAGSFDQTLMNLSGISGMLFTMAGSLIYAKKRNN